MQPYSWNWVAAHRSLVDVVNHSFALIPAALPRLPQLLAETQCYIWPLLLIPTPLQILSLHNTQKKPKQNQSQFNWLVHWLNFHCGATMLNRPTNLQKGEWSFLLFTVTLLPLALLSHFSAFACYCFLAEITFSSSQWQLVSFLLVFSPPLH